MSFELLSGRLSERVMEILCRPSTGMFPEPGEISLSCSCPDGARLCKHLAAVQLEERLKNIEQRYRRDGFVVLEQALSTTDVEQLRAETAAICRGETEESEIAGQLALAYAALARRHGAVSKEPEPIPSEIELAARFRVSQGTVRKAIDGLVARAESALVLAKQRGRNRVVALSLVFGGVAMFIQLTFLDLAARACPK